MYRLKSDAVTGTFGIGKQVFASFAAQSVNLFSGILLWPGTHTKTMVQVTRFTAEIMFLATKRWDLSWNLSRHIKEDNQSKLNNFFVFEVLYQHTINLLFNHRPVIRIRRLLISRYSCFPLISNVRNVIKLWKPILYYDCTIFEKGNNLSESFL